MQGISATLQHCSPVLFTSKPFSISQFAMKINTLVTQKRLVPAEDVAKACCKGEAMQISSTRRLALFCSLLWLLVSCFLSVAMQLCAITTWQHTIGQYISLFLCSNIGSMCTSDGMLDTATAYRVARANSVLPGSNNLKSSCKKPCPCPPNFRSFRSLS